MTKCLYHGNCNDGIAAAAVVWRAHPNMDPDKDFVAVQYGQEPPWDAIDGHDVIIVDFSYKRPTVLEIQRRAASLLILDHHKSAERELAGINGAVFRMDQCGAVMAWNHFFPDDDMPELLLYVQDRDLWTKKLADTDAIAMRLRSFPLDLRHWSAFLNSPIDNMKHEGRAINRWFQLQCSQLVKTWSKAPTYVEIDGYFVPAVNAASFMASEVAGALAEGKPFAAVFFHVPKGVVYSLRRRDGDVDLSEIAAAYGGGGHPAAAGFMVPHVLPYVQFEEGPK